MATTPIIPTPVKGVWEEQKSKLMSKFPILTDADLKFEEGKKEEMMVRLQTKLGKTKEELDAVLLAL